MKAPVLTLDDFSPEEANFKLKSKPGKTFTICPFTLRVRAWVTKTYGRDRFKEVLEKNEMEEIAKIIFFMLKDKSEFKDIDDFMENVVTVNDYYELVTALTVSLGVSEPKQEEIKAAMAEEEKKGNEEAPSASATTGA